MIQKVLNYLKHDIWRVRVQKLSRRKSLLIRSLRIFILSLREFGHDQCYFRASALTFYSLLSIVPVFAMAFGVAKGFGMEKLLEERLLDNMQGQEEVVTRVIEFSSTFLENTKGGLIAGIGILLLFWTIVKVLGNIEKSFNEIFGVHQNRSFGRKFGDYMALMMICPVILIFSGSLTVFVTSQVTVITEQIGILGMFGPIIFGLVKLVPYTVIWGLLTFLYIFMPNTKVQFSSALLGGIVAGTLYQFFQALYVHFQIGVANYNAIYGSFAALPLFLMWLQISWLVVLFGAEIAFAHQNEETYEFESDCLQISESFKELLTLRIAHVCIQAFKEGKEPWTARKIAQELEMPIRLVRQLVDDLAEAGVLTEIKDANGRVGSYQPARDINTLTVKSVLDAINQHGHDQLPVNETKELEKLRNCLKDFHASLEKSPSNLILKDL